MPRIARVVVKDCAHHVTQRGNYKQITFGEDEDYRKYLAWLDEYSKKHKLTIVSYCLMPNHVHFIVIPHEIGSLAKTFNACHMRYSQYYNKKNENTGHLWQGRFYSCALDEMHLYEAIRYVENNPVRAKLVKEAVDWKYSSAKAHIEGSNNSGGLKIGEINKCIEVNDWIKYLKEKETSNILKEVKANTLTGRPSGSNEFIEKLERIFGKRLRPLPEGRPKK